MDTSLIRKRRWFFSWQDQEKEAWLGEMSRQGLHLKKVGTLGSYYFEKGAPREVAYRLDFNRSKPAQDYIQMIRDAGWEHLGSRAGWEYWRKAIENGKVPEIFTDNASKMQMYQRLVAIYFTSAPAIYVVMLAAFKRFPGRHPDWFVVLFIVVYMTYIVYAFINTMMILRRINQLRKH